MRLGLGDCILVGIGPLVAGSLLDLDLWALDGWVSKRTDVVSTSWTSSLVDGSLSVWGFWRCFVALCRTLVFPIV